MKNLLFAILMLTGVYGNSLLSEGMSKNGLVCFRYYEVFGSSEIEIPGEPWELHPVKIMKITDKEMIIYEDGTKQEYINAGEGRYQGLLYLVFVNKKDHNDGIMMRKLKEGDVYTLGLRYYRIFQKEEQVYKYRCGY
jgi:hypothetical protein